jgi:hypothetical protein
MATANQTNNRVWNTCTTRAVQLRKIKKQIKQNQSIQAPNKSKLSHIREQVERKVHVLVLLAIKPEADSGEALRLHQIGHVTIFQESGHFVERLT